MNSYKHLLVDELSTVHEDVNIYKWIDTCRLGRIDWLFNKKLDYAHARCVEMTSRISSRLLAGGDFHACPLDPWEKWGTSLVV